jgi:hypothetical protein
MIVEISRLHSSTVVGEIAVRVYAGDDDHGVEKANSTVVPLVEVKPFDNLQLRSVS